MADESLVTQALNRILLGEQAHRDRVRDYDRCYDVYRATEKAKQPRGKRRKDWESDIRVPYGQQVIDTAMVNLIGGKPRAVVRPRRPEYEQAAKAIQRIMDYHVGEDHLAEKQVAFTQQALIYGITAAKIHWLYREQKQRTTQWLPHPTEPGKMVPSKVDQTVVLRDGPTFEPWDVYGFWYEPNARDVESAGYVVFQSWASTDDLRSMERTEAQPWGIYRNVDRCLAGASSTMASDSAQERFIGGGYNRRKDRHELLEIWTDDEVMVIGNRATVMRYEDNPYDHGQKPAVAPNVRPDLFELRGMSETELLDHLQQSMWSMMNMIFDNVHLTGQAGFTYREAGVVDPNALEVKPRFKWPVMDHDDIRPVQMPQLPPEVFSIDQLLLGRMQLVTGINPYVSGADLNTVDQNTATGVTALQEVASRLLRFKARQLAFQGYQRTFEQWVELVKQFTSKEQAIRIDGADGTYEWEHIQPWDIAGNFDVVVEGTEESLSRQQERAEAMGLLNAIGPLLQLPGVNFAPVARKLESSFDMAEGSLYQTPQAPPPPPPAAPNGNGNGGLPPAGIGQQALQPGSGLYTADGSAQ